MNNLFHSLMGDLPVTVLVMKIFVKSPVKIFLKSPLLWLNYFNYSRQAIYNSVVKCCADWYHLCLQYITITSRKIDVLLSSITIFVTAVHLNLPIWWHKLPLATISPGRNSIVKPLQCLNMCLLFPKCREAVTLCHLVMHICICELSHHWFRFGLLGYSVPVSNLKQWWITINWTLRNKLQWIWIEMQTFSFKKMHL